MPRMNTKLLSRMKKAGYIPLAQAAELCGMSPMGVKRWLTASPPKVASSQVGACWFVDYASMLGHLGPEAVKALGLPYPAGAKPKKPKAEQ